MATIQMSADKVIDACNATIAHINEVRTTRNELAIARVMSTKHGFFKRYLPTREQAIDILDSSTNYMGWRSYYAYGDLNKALALKKLAEHGDPVTLNEDDVRVLF